jgi:hypothetical protein
MEAMTPSELNKICCDFVGLAPTNTSTAHNGAMELCWYPPVSTDGAAMLRLMEALAAKNIWARVSRHVTKQKYSANVGFIHCDSDAARTADSGPTALCLAVAELAKSSLQTSDSISTVPDHAPPPVADPDHGSKVKADFDVLDQEQLEREIACAR